MNALSNKYKCLSIISGNFSKIFVKNYALSNLPIKWVMPEKLECYDPRKSGDRGIDFQISENDYIQNVNKSSEIQNADEIVKKLFTVKFNHRKELKSLKIAKARKLVQRYEQDNSSLECSIAATTASILHMQEIQYKFPYNKKAKHFLKELIERRNKLLKILRTKDYACFEFLLEKLNLVYRPYPEEGSFPTIKGNTRKLLEKYCNELKEKKIEEYKKELKSQQKDFFKKKLEKLEFIRSEEIACGVTPTVTEEEIAAAKLKAESFA